VAASVQIWLVILMESLVITIRRNYEDYGVAEPVPNLGALKTQVVFRV